MFILKGKVIAYKEKNINTDLIIPSRYLTKSDPDHLASHCMEDLDPHFPRRVVEENFTVLVSESNFGCGSSREQAPIAIKSAGIKFVIASSFARIFFRNSINVGLGIIELSDVSDFDTGDEIDIDLLNGFVDNLSKKKKFEFKQFPGFIQKIIESNGLVGYARKKIL